MKKYDIRTGIFSRYRVPKGWKVKLFPGLMEHVNCASCGKVILTAASERSNEILSENGIGYHICDECYAREMDKIMEVKKHENVKNMSRMWANLHG